LLEQAQAFGIKLIVSADFGSDVISQFTLPIPPCRVFVWS